jgi:4-amino-4-deoxy-L-arabinose transferase-like glycosyltransferase
VLVAFAIVRRTAREEQTALVGAALVAFFPGFVSLSAFVTNDNLVVFLGAMYTYFALRFASRTTVSWMLATGATFGLLLTTKLSVLPLALLIPMLALLAPTWRRRLWLFTCGSLATVAVSGWYLVQNWVRYGDPLAKHESTIYLMRLRALGNLDYFGVPLPYSVEDPVHLVLVDVPRTIITTMWYQSDWNRYNWPEIIGVLCTCVVLVVLVGLIGQRIPKRTLAVLGGVSLLSLVIVWVMAFQTATYSSRYAYVGITAMAALVALALQRWPLPFRWVLPAASLIACLLSINSYVLSVTHWAGQLKLF